MLVYDWPHSVWTKSLVCKDAVLQGIPLFRSVSEDSALLASQKIYGSLSTVRMLICPLFHPSERRAIPSGCPDRPSIIRPDDVDFGPDPLLYREASVPTCICPDVSPACLDASQYSTKLQILSKFIYGKIDATVRTTWIPVRTCFSLRQESQFKFNRPDASLPSSGRACT
jgi:hypothetical protein